jgi:hypothetical protein
MTAGDISDRIIARIDDSPSAPASCTAPEVMAAINEGQQLAGLLTLFLEKTTTFQIPGASPWFQIRSVLADYLVPLRLVVGGARIRPSTLAGLDARSSAWQATAGTPAYYAAVGCDLVAITPQPAGQTASSLTYAASPAAVTSVDTPQLPEAYHQSLVSYGKYRVRLKEGAQSLSRGLEDLNSFLDDIQLLGDYVRARSRAARFDQEPFELARFDRSRLIGEVLKWQAKSIASKS